MVFHCTCMPVLLITKRIWENYSQDLPCILKTNSLCGCTSLIIDLGNPEFCPVWTLKNMKYILLLLPLNSAYNNCLWFTLSTTSWVLTIAALATRKECSLPTAKASFTTLLMSSFAKNLPSLFVNGGHHIFALHQQLLIIFKAKQNVWLTLKIYLKI